MIYDPNREFYAPYTARDLERSFCFWCNLVPEVVAHAQARWELDQRIRRAVDAGATLTEIAKHMGVSVTSVGNRNERARRKPPNRYKTLNIGPYGHPYARSVQGVAPVARYMQQPPHVNPDQNRGTVLS